MKEEDRFDYPKDVVKPGGRLDQLLQNYDNIYADLSAGSGYNALTRDPSFINGFLTRNQNKVLFGTDLVFKGQKVQQHTALESTGISKEVLQKIYFSNAAGLLNL
jgi:predicted TIM-barrel fold metal-dependent hydrolase